MRNYYPHPKMKCLVALLYSDSPAIAIHSSLATEVFPECYTRVKKKKEKGFFLLLQHLPNFPTK